LSIYTDWTSVLQKELSAQEEVVGHLNISMQPMAPPTTTSNGQPPSPQEKESQLAKSQLGFIDTFANPLWTIGSELFFSGMLHGVNQIHENRNVWVVRMNQTAIPPPLPLHKDEGTSSLSTTATGTTETSVETPQTPYTRVEVRRIVSSSDLNDVAQKQKMRKERSFSSLIFWRKKLNQKQQQQKQQEQPQQQQQQLGNGK
jgi:hypothetical protein